MYLPADPPVDATSEQSPCGASSTTVSDPNASIATEEDVLTPQTASASASATSVPGAQTNGNADETTPGSEPGSLTLDVGSQDLGEKPAQKPVSKLFLRWCYHLVHVRSSFVEPVLITDGRRRSRDVAGIVRLVTRGRRRKDGRDEDADWDRWL